MKKATDEIIGPVDTKSRMRIFANIIIDRLLGMATEERRELDKKIKASKNKT